MKPVAEPGAIQILATEEAGEGRLELWFDAAPLILRRVVSFARSGPIDLIVHAGPQPYFGWSPSYPVIFDWPRIPEARQDVSAPFTNDDGATGEEILHFLGQSKFEITMTVRRKVDAGFVETRHSTQVWNEGSPWWTSAAITTDSNIDGVASSTTNISGRLIP
jgi:hypothetical protein